MNKFSALLLGSTALTFVAINPVSALTISETTDFGNSFASRTIIDATATTSPTASGSAAASGAASASGPSGPFAGITIFGKVNTGTDPFDYFTLTGLTAGQSVNIDLRPAADASGAFSSNPRSFAITLLNSVGSVIDFPGDSFEAAASSGDVSSGASSSGGASSGSGSTAPSFTTIFSPDFNFDATALTTGELNFRIEGATNYLEDYSVVV